MPPLKTDEELRQRITELERRLADSEAEAGRYRTLFDIFPHAVTISDNSGKIIETNEAAERLLGVGKNQQLRRTIDGEEWRIIGTDGMPLPQEHWASVIALKEKRPVFNQVMGIVKSKKETVWINVCAAPLPQDGGGVLITYSDITARRLAEERLADSERMFRRFFDNSGFYGFITSPEGFILETNRTVATVLGYTKEELKGQPLSSILYQEGNNGGEDFFDEWKRTGRIRNAELAVRAKDGSKRWVILNAGAVKDEQGAIIRSSSILVDITHRRLTEVALQESEEKYRMLFHNANDAIFVHQLNDDEQTQSFSEVNTTACELYGYSREEFMRLSPVDLMTQEKRHAARNTIDPTLDKGSQVFRTFHVCKNGRKFPVEISSYAFDLHGRKTILSIIRDISDRLAAEDEIKESESRYRTLFMQNPNPIAVIDAKGNYLDANEAFMRFVEQPLERLQSMNAFDFSPPGKTNEQQETHFPTWSTGGVIETEYYVNGTVKLLELSISPIRYKGIEAVIGVGKDITEEKRMASRIEQAQKLESIGTLAGGIAHDFNNILAPIIGMSEMLLEDLEPDSQQHRNAMHIFQAGERAAALVKQILAFGRQAETKTLPIEIQPILKEVLELCRATIPVNIPIHHTVQKDCGRIMANPTQIHQVAMNLITNAYHAVEANDGTITFELQEVEVHENSGNILSPGCYARLTCSDTGHGIAAEHREKIFEPYFTTKQADKGTGLGLAMVYGIVKEHGGDISVSSEVGRGTTIKVMFPLLQDSDIAKEKLLDPAAVTGSEHILLVDDEPALLKMVKQMLERLGYQVTTSSNGREALQMFTADPDQYDLVITDMTMPGMTGDKLALALRSSSPGARIIICTGFSEKINRQTVEAMGLDGLLLKPVVRSDLARMVRQVLEKDNTGNPSP